MCEGNATADGGRRAGCTTLTTQTKYFKKNMQKIIFRPHVRRHRQEDGDLPRSVRIGRQRQTTKRGEEKTHLLHRRRGGVNIYFFKKIKLCVGK